ncbi:N-carbamoyl-L-amino acid amidohydrolase [Idiomarina zobellii]|jgi:negative modulator of initiation of replication|uniref:Negative modulator of initiation of replication n=1 Tax=Idiomarina zobellii TaxID=86103 RepID=A0A837NHF8_9GAMM|nr:N-carbamoyl-L-amino acid amidohydrolase [Idiomarina zobellii]KPD24870.1 N-carbamyl-L-amino acid amidohydrolase [Idiomarina zobellii]SDF30235.1 negative regulator of replication initiation SeqA [Idiomarina zobellii]|tara:strand:- start:454 stop:942 length:489 start_codon:yes stop_codon:yes gene_type:complete
MKRIDIDDDLYAYIASHTREIGESASDILRRLLDVDKTTEPAPAKPEKTKADSVFNRLNEQDVRIQKSVVARFLYILSMLYKSHSDRFADVLDIRGRDRQYFARTEDALLSTGNSTNPKQIPDAPYWVITNTNTTKKKSMLTQVAKTLGYSSADAEKIRDFL